MALPWISVNSRLQSGVSLINSIETKRFVAIANRIVKKSNNELKFTEEELKKLEETLSLDENQLQLLLQSVAHIFKQASKVVLKPTVLQKNLIQVLKFDKDKAEEIVKLWTKETKESFDYESRQKLEDISWELNLQHASKYCNKETVPKARLQFGLVSVKDNKKDNIVLELNEEELIGLYGTLENVQTKLDVIQNIAT